MGVMWCVVMRALKTTTQLWLAVRSSSVSARVQHSGHDGSDPRTPLSHGRPSGGRQCDVQPERRDDARRRLEYKTREEEEEEEEDDEEEEESSPRSPKNDLAQDPLLQGGWWRRLLEWLLWPDSASEPWSPPPPAAASSFHLSTASKVEPLLTSNTTSAPTASRSSFHLSTASKVEPLLTSNTTSAPTASRAVNSTLTFLSQAPHNWESHRHLLLLLLLLLLLQDFEREVHPDGGAVVLGEDLVHVAPDDGRLADSQIPDD
ncbi:hypothetical protein CRUP_004188 [Coryphaenoides rupestris]|nr:hypothetical protein CRUP_004188 [Coryphaenoides rupestris]